MNFSFTKTVTALNLSSPCLLSVHYRPDRPGTPEGADQCDDTQHTALLSVIIELRGATYFLSFVTCQSLQEKKKNPRINYYEMRRIKIICRDDIKRTLGPIDPLAPGKPISPGSPFSPCYWTGTKTMKCLNATDFWSNSLKVFQVVQIA